MSGGHLKGVVAPQVMCIGPGMAIGVGGKLIAAGAEESVDLVVGGEEPLRLPGRLEPAHQFLTLAGRAVRSFDAVVQAFVRSVICPRGQFADRPDITAKLVGYDDPRRAEPAD